MGFRCADCMFAQVEHSAQLDQVSLQCSRGYTLLVRGSTEAPQCFFATDAEQFSPEVDPFGHPYYRRSFVCHEFVHRESLAPQLTQPSN